MILPPLLIMSVSLAIFEHSASMTEDDFIRSIQSVAQVATPPDFARTLLEARGRYIWLASVVLNIIVPIGAAVLCGFPVDVNGVAGLGEQRQTVHAWDPALIDG